MESQRRRHKINERRSLLQSNAWKITIASDLPTLQLASNAQPIVRGLQRQMNVLAGLQFDNRQPSGARHGEQVENAVFAPPLGSTCPQTNRCSSQASRRVVLSRTMGFSAPRRLPAGRER